MEAVYETFDLWPRPRWLTRIGFGDDDLHERRCVLAILSRCWIDAGIVVFWRLGLGLESGVLSFRRAREEELF